MYTAVLADAQGGPAPVLLYGVCVPYQRTLLVSAHAYDHTVCQRSARALSLRAVLRVVSVHRVHSRMSDTFW